MKLCLNGATTMPYELEQDISAAAQAGFEGLEIWWDKLRAYLENHSTGDLRESLNSHHLKPVAICPLLLWPFRDTGQARQSFEEAVQIAPQIGCDTLIICPDFQPARMTREEALSAHAEELARLARFASERGLRLAIEPIGGHTLVPGPNEALELAKLAGAPSNVGLVMDTFHYFRSGVSLEAVRAIPLEKLYIVHVNDCEDIPLNELEDRHRLYPTLGVMPLKQMLSVVKEKGYQGYLSVEVFRPSYWEQPIQEIATAAHLYLSRLLSTL